MAHATSKKEIRRNPLAEWVGFVVRLVREQRTILLAVLAVVVVLAAGGAAYEWYQSRQEAEAGVALADAQAALRGDKPGAPGNPDEAMRRFQTIGQQFRGTESAEESLIRLGNLQFDNGKLDEAKATFGNYLTSYPRGRFVMLAGLGKAYAEEAKGDLQAAAQTLSDVLNRRGDSALAGEAYSALTRMYEGLKKTEEAMRVYNQIVERYPQSTWAKNALDRMSALKTK
jgi:predicted negative regulator of RcsB-dependent stress response